LAIGSLSMVANAINYATNLIFSHLLTPLDYGELTALLAVFAIVSLPVGAAQVVVAHRVASLKEADRPSEIRRVVRYAFAHTGTIGAAATIVYILAIPIVIVLFHLQHPGPAIALTPFIFLAFIQPVQTGLLQGLGWFRGLGLYMCTVALAQLLLGALWVLSGGGAGAAIGGEAIGTLLALCAAAYLTRTFIAPRGEGLARGGLRRRPTARTSRATLAFILFAIAANIDIVLAKIVLSPQAAGIYAAIATVGKFTLFVPTALTYVLVPDLAKARARGADVTTPLRRAARLTIVIGIVVGLPFALFPQAFVDLMFGTRYAAAAAGVRPIIVAGIALALLLMLCTFSTAVGGRRWLVIATTGVAVQCIMIGIFHASPTMIAWMDAVALVATLLINELVGHPILRRPRRT
jgi:O-antigen/teichoic acid export membrane protein